jgi:hypothetical protein
MMLALLSAFIWTGARTAGARRARRTGVLVLTLRGCGMDVVLTVVYLLGR